MKAMILAAGIGTRLRPLTDSRPKALVEINGRTLLEITLTRLREFGINNVIINTHHFADMMADYLRSHANFGMRITVSREDELLDTGGGLKKASSFFDDGPFLLHNVDVLSNIDLRLLTEAHRETQALATLAVQDRRTSRYLLFDESLQLRGRAPEPDPNFVSLAFSGIHLISPHIFDLLTEDGVFSIITAYLRLAAAGESIRGFRADNYYWRDVGKPESLAQAGAELAKL